MTRGLPGVPETTADRGDGPAVVEVVETLFDVAAADALDLPGYRYHRRAGYGDAIGALLLDAARAQELTEALRPGDHALPILLTGAGGTEPGSAEQARQQVRAARDLLSEDDRVELVGVRLPLLSGTDGRDDTDGTAAARHLLDALDFTVPAWVELSIDLDWRRAMAVIAADGVEHLTLLLDGASPEEAATMLRAAVDLDLAFRLGGADLPVVTGRGGVVGWLNVLCAVRAALDGAQTAALADLLTERDPTMVSSVVRRMSPADAANTRALLVAVETPDVEATLDRLGDLRLLARG